MRARELDLLAALHWHGPPPAGLPAGASMENEFSC